ncbi:DUF3833 domain-containing protein [Ferrimonas sediminicola]|uniref:DUF3833 domain-containing protein n=1 Tax=Ferrimonas sediminicola TaxID=2569538 RepID=A0A4U1BFF2_9GAMM|nr:DUF3833 domain-containing protein [Ferrimonas sediminicola]TKB49407.1 DUF3833 domain-containing protein [Ferrimonas sediminicola]
MRVLIVLMITLLVGCSADHSALSSRQPPLELERFFDGRVTAQGMVTNFRGEVIRRFSVTLDGRWQQGEGVLDEYFLYDDGETQFRQWRIERTGPNSYQGEADDIIGTASGERHGPLLRWQYEMVLVTDDDEWQVSFDDLMVLVDDRHLLNRAKITKFGITVAEVFIAFQKE